jgi:HK97 family phage portal protein
VVDVARDFLVPPEMIGASIEGSSSLTYANAQDRLLHFVTLTLQPWITRFEQTISDELLAPQNQYVKFDVRGLLRGNSEQRIAFYQGLAALGAITVEEVRQFEDLEPMPAGATPAMAPVKPGVAA